MSDQPGYPQNPEPQWQPQQPYSQQQPGGQPYQWPAAPPPGYQQPPPGYQAQWQPTQPPKKKRSKMAIGCGSIAGLFVLIIVIVAIAAVASSGNGVTKNSSSNSPAAATGQSSAAQSSAPASGNLNGPIGTTFTVTDTNNSGDTVKYSVTLDKVLQHAAPSDSFNTAPSGDHLAAAEFTIKGISGTDQDSADNDAAVVGNDSQTYQTGLESVAAGTDFDNAQFNTSPGSVSVGWVSFEVKNGITVTSVQWSPSSGMSGSAPATWTVSG